MLGSLGSTLASNDSARALLSVVTMLNPLALAQAISAANLQNTNNHDKNYSNLKLANCINLSCVGGG